jgi:choline dehydrogenase-like flavoprotein
LSAITPLGTLRFMADDLFATGTPSVVEDFGAEIECDIAIVGSGAGGSTFAWALRESGARILVLERGDFLPHEWQNWSAREVHERQRYQNSDLWLDGNGQPFVSGTYHYVGGCTKLYGAAMPRLRENDFGEVRTHDGISPGWPVSYAELEPFYARAEQLYGVHGDDSDPTSPWRSSPYPYPPIPHEPPVAAVANGLQRQGLRPFSMPMAIDRREGGRCILCRTCDSFPCLLDAKGDAEVSALRPALMSPTVRLLTRANVTRVGTTGDGSQITHLEVRRDSRPAVVKAAKYVIAAGAVNTAALLLRSGAESASTGLANSSGQVGRNYMKHTSTFIVGVRPGRKHDLVFEKTLGVNDWYHAGPTNEFPLGNVQSLGKIQAPMIKGIYKRFPRAVLPWFTDRSVEFFLETEDLPRAENRVRLEPSGRIQLLWQPTNVVPHRELVKRMSAAVRRCGYPLIVTHALGLAGTAHQCGTARMGEDPVTSVVDQDCRAHDVENMWIVDASVFPSSGAVNPALTVAANALRVAAGDSWTG